MIKDITITVLPDEEGNESLIRRKVAEALSKEGPRVAPEAISALAFRKKSVDARRGRVLVCLRYTAYVGELPPEGETDRASFVPAWKRADPARRVVIVGSGPAGLFAALRLLEDGITPILVERGKPTPERKRDIADITRAQRVDENSNYCFGEGGAGTFSDGKLYTRSNKRGDVGRVLAILHRHGADKAILTDAHPHVGSDLLPGIINRVRETIVSHGGEFRFGARFTGLVMEGGRVAGIETEPVAGGALERVMGDAVILATGHSARDVYAILAREEIALNGALGPRDPGYRAVLEAKGFAMGVRVEHPRELVDKIQYHGRERGDDLPAATYRLVAQVEGRGVYSFCMCPGGLIVPSATSDREIVVNGMSPSGRNTRWSNAAIVVETRVEDTPPEHLAPVAAGIGAGESEPDGLPNLGALAGLRYQAWLERETKRHGDGQRAPAQRLEDFIAGRDSASLPECSYSPGVVPSRLDRWLPEAIARRLRAGFLEFGKNMRGFICPEAILVASETRTSSPVRILRDPETLESAALAGLYPAGEGSGYAGGIASSAMDGERCAGMVARALQARGDGHGQDAIAAGSDR